MTYDYVCSQVVPTCTYVGHGSTREEAIADARAHISDQHADVVFNDALMDEVHTRALREVRPR